MLLVTSTSPSSSLDSLDLNCQVVEKAVQDENMTANRYRRATHNHMNRVSLLFCKSSTSVDSRKHHLP
jgi:hypothetical protein